MTKTLVSTELSITSLGEIFAKSGFFSDAKDASKAIVKILAGQELGLPPVASMTGIDIIKGKVSLSAGVMATILKKYGGYDYRIKKHDSNSCEIEFFYKEEPLGISSFTIEDATQAGIFKINPLFKKYPRNMLFARAMSNGIRWYCPEVLGGPTYTPGELEPEAEIVEDEIIDISQQVDSFAARLRDYEEIKSLAIELAQSYNGMPAHKAKTILPKIQETYPDCTEENVKEMLK